MSCIILYSLIICYCFFFVLYCQYVITFKILLVYYKNSGNREFGTTIKT